MNFFKKHPIISNLLLGVLVFFLIIWGVLRWLNHYTRHDKSVEIPHGIIGMMAEEATSLLNDMNLELVVSDTVYMKNSKIGTIHKVTPPEGNRVKEHRTIFATVYTNNPPLLGVPEITDMSQRQATALLKSVGFERVIVKEVDGEYKGLVLGLLCKSDTVRVGQRCQYDAPMTLLVSSGNAVPEPYLFGSDSITIESTSEEDSWF